MTSRQRAPRAGLKGGRYRSYSLAERLAARTTKGETCWIVSGHALPNGYLQLKTRVNGRQESINAHRLAWELAHGPVPAGLRVCHRCDVPACVNPDHLFLGTQADNVHDCITKGRRNAFGIQKLHPDQVRAIRALAAEHGLTHRQIGQRFGVAKSTVQHIIARRAWGWLTDHAALDTVFERVPSVQLPVRGEVA